MCNLRCTYVNRYVQLEVGITVLLPNICFSNVFLCMNMGLFGYDYKLLFRRENARSEKIPPNALRYGRLSTSRLQLAGRVCTENQESEIAATISILCIAARPSRGFLVSEDKQALYTSWTRKAARNSQEFGFLLYQCHRWCCASLVS